MVDKFQQISESEQNVFDNIYLSEYLFSWLITTSGAAITQTWYPRQIDASREVLIARKDTSGLYEYAWAMSLRRSDEDKFKFAFTPKLIKERKDNKIYASATCVVPKRHPAYELFTQNGNANVKGKTIEVMIPSKDLLPIDSFNYFYDLEFLIRVKVAWKEDFMVGTDQILSSQLNTDIGKLYQNQVYTDVTFVFEEEKKEIRAHKLILKARSAVFREMFKNDTPMSMVTRVVIKGVGVATFHELLRYLYTERVPNTVMLAQLLIAAEKYQLTQLIDFCKGQLKENDGQ